MSNCIEMRVLCRSRCGTDPRLEGYRASGNAEIACLGDKF